jgi:hypothetical protein
MRVMGAVFGPLGKLLVKFEVSPPEVMVLSTQKRAALWPVTSLLLRGLSMLLLTQRFTD